MSEHYADLKNATSAGQTEQHAAYATNITVEGVRRRISYISVSREEIRELRLINAYASGGLSLGLAFFFKWLDVVVGAAPKDGEAPAADDNHFFILAAAILFIGYGIAEGVRSWKKVNAVEKQCEQASDQNAG